MTQQNPRDPGKIASAFPSRSEGIMANLKAFDKEVRATVEHEQNKANALAAEGSSGKTSRRSPSRPSAATRQQLTGVKENTDVQGWFNAVSMPHLCFPPNQYPQGAGPGSLWCCRCDAVWRAEGIAWEEYPTTPKRLELLKPERWFYIEGGQRPEADYRAQEGLYDWRPLGPYYVKLYRAMLDTLQGKGDADWRDMP